MRRERKAKKGVLFWQQSYSLRVSERGLQRLSLLLSTFWGMCECLVTSLLGTEYLNLFFLTVLLGFLGGTSLVWGIGKKNVFSIS